MIDSSVIQHLLYTYMMIPQTNLPEHIHILRWLNWSQLIVINKIRFPYVLTTKLNYLPKQILVFSETVLYYFKLQNSWSPSLHQASSSSTEKGWLSWISTKLKKIENQKSIFCILQIANSLEFWLKEIAQFRFWRQSISCVCVCAVAVRNAQLWDS